MPWEIVIGLEVHAQLATQSKIFSGAATAFGAAPNTHVGAVDCGLPGVLPVLNQRVVEMAVTFGLAVDAVIPEVSIFARKNYFYPDLPKGYQISQLEHPIVKQGHLMIDLDDNQQKRIGITRAHLEEDAGKSLHGIIANQSGIDLNRAGTPLLEIVSEPDLRSAEEAVIYLKRLHSLVRYLGICDGNMQEGSFRCDANVSVRPLGERKLGTRTELKNINSFRFVEKAITFEAQRHIAVIEAQGTIHQETRLYDAALDQTRSMRSKEEANDYRYFPDPDLLPVHIDPAFLESIRQQLPELPWQKQARFESAFDLSHYDAALLTQERAMADYFEATLTALMTQAGKQTLSEAQAAKRVANWCLGDITKYLNQTNTAIEDCAVNADALALLLVRILDNTLSGKMAKTVFESMWQTGHSADTIIREQNLAQITDSAALGVVIDTIIANNPKQVEQYRGGKEKLLGFFVGQVMKQTQGKANPEHVNSLLKTKLQG